MNDLSQYHADAMDLRAIENTGRLDANEGLFFARSLEYIRTKMYQFERAPLSAMELFPIDTSVPEGANYITWREWDTVGMAKIIASYADDLPRADVKGYENTTPIRTIGLSYGYNTQEIRNSTYTGIALDVKRAYAARRAHEELINRLAWAGDTLTGLPGFLSNTNVPAYVLPATGTGSTKAWSGKTADQIIADLNGITNSVYVTTSGVHRVTQIWLPLAKFAYINSQPRSTTTDTTILAFFLANNPGVTVKAVLELTGAGAGGTDRMVAIDNSSDVYQMNIPMLLKQYAPQQRNLEFVVPMESRFGGVTIERPLAITYADGL